MCDVSIDKCLSASQWGGEGQILPCRATFSTVQGIVLEISTIPSTTTTKDSALEVSTATTQESVLEASTTSTTSETTTKD